MPVFIHYRFDRSLVKAVTGFCLSAKIRNSSKRGAPDGKPIRTVGTDEKECIQRHCLGVEYQR